MSLVPFLESPIWACGWLHLWCYPCNPAVPSLTGALVKNMTYEDWKLAGYQVKKGAKACGRDPKGHAVFSRDQVQGCIDSPSEPCPVCGYYGPLCKCKLSLSANPRS